MHPGPDYSVADVERGWVKALKNQGCDVAIYNLNDRLCYYAAALINGKRLDGPQILEHAGYGLHGKLWEWWPDLIIVISGFYVLPITWELLKYRDHKTVIMFTESPYEDDRQLSLVEYAKPDVVILNDPTNRERFDAVHDDVHFFGHSYDPEIHYPGRADRSVDFSFVGSGYPSRAEFLEQVDWTGLNVEFAGNWKDCNEPLRSFLIHPQDQCYENEDAAGLYRRTKVSANLYRAEANSPELSAGWACGPREIELAATETFFLRQSRGESDELFPMLPTFTEPGDFSAQLRWWLAHDKEREDAARRAREAVAGRTFDVAARRLLKLVGE